MPENAKRLISRPAPYLESVEEKIAHQPVLHNGGQKVASALHQGVLKGGEPTRQVADFLHGTWLGHSLHAVLTDITVGAWSMGMLFDALGLIQRSPEWQHAGDALTATGVISAVPTALAGVTDYSTIDQPAAGTGALHAVANTAALGIYIGSLLARRKGRRGLGIGLSTLGFSTAFFSAWLGGELVYRHQVGVDHADRFEATEKWTAVLRSSELREGQPRCAEYEGKKVLLARDENGIIHAIGAVCSHAGGPLEDGKIENGQVECPWHQSVFDLKTGFVVHGPATRPQQPFETRVQGDQIEIRPRAV